MTITAGLIAIYSISISVAAFFHTPDHIFRQTQWQNSITCKLLNSIFIASIFLTKFTALVMVGNQLLVTKYAMVYQPLSKKSILFLLWFGWFLIGTLIFVGNALSTLNSHSDLCIIQDNIEERSFVNYYFHFVLVLINLSITIIVAFLFYVIVRHVKLSSRKAQTVSKSTRIYMSLVRYAIITISAETATLMLFLSILILQLTSRFNTVTTVMTLLPVNILALIHMLPLLLRR